MSFCTGNTFKLFDSQCVFMENTYICIALSTLILLHSTIYVHVNKITGLLYGSNGQRRKIRWRSIRHVYADQLHLLRLSFSRGWEIRCLVKDFMERWIFKEKSGENSISHVSGRRGKRTETSKKSLGSWWLTCRNKGHGAKIWEFRDRRRQGHNEI